ncbi:acyl-ACP--UDP-N-acetylglucosamine O-acyltransferase [Spiribacter sp. C176]|uniref:Acyl-[acyl-carrier-protein]--UDP-N-acetylglucosamine O-acyltransferase n=1 Tax=Spiribacter salilacus TaxID=2664894 RepID=A0A6N7QL53_9GAMM|nr:acyl-ACP--UDP-N-acetylglucosamine O-acyltransferase [Spiribacter salilacus]
MSDIHPTAIIDPSAKIASGVRIGPYAVIDADVEIGSGCDIGPHVVLRGPMRLGARNRIFQFASIGEIPQDKKFAGESSSLEIGDDNTIREFVTINRGTADGGGATRIGNKNWIMAYVHIAHDCQVGNEVVFANGSSLAGHVEVGDWATLGGFTLVHQFCRLGTGSFSAMGSCVRQDVPPFVTIAGDPALPHGINIEGLKRRGYSTAAQQSIRKAYRTLYKRGLRLQDALDAVSNDDGGDPAVEAFVRFIKASERGIVR